SLAGQISGTGIAGGAGEFIKDVGLGTMGAGLIGEIPSGGTSTALVVGGGAAAITGEAIEVGAEVNAVRVTVALAKATTGGPKAKDASGVTSGGQATDEHGNKLGPSGEKQINKTTSKTREAARNKALKEGSGATEHRNPRVGKSHWHPTTK